MKVGNYLGNVAISDTIPQTNLARQAATEQAYPDTRVRKIVVALSIYAGLRILIFAAAFPLFNNVDERLHLMSIQMYAQGHLPGKELPRIDPELAKAYLPYWSPEYGHSEQELDRDGISGSPDRNLVQANGFSQPIYAQKLEEWLRRPNFEAQAPPLYYLVAGGWYRIGAAMGLSDWRLLYWTRFLNGILYGLFVWVSYRFVCQVYPKGRFLCVAVPALLAVFPQDVFFGMNRDVLSPLMCAAALLFMAKALAERQNQASFLMIASLLVGLSFLVEVSNCVLYGALLATVWLWAFRSPRMLRDKVRVLSASTVASVLPPSLWMLRNYFVLGDLTGSAAKVRVLGWTAQPWPAIIRHPLFSWRGLSFFAVRLTENFWHGEYGWHAERMRSASADWFYVISSALMIVIFTIDFVRRRKILSDIENWAGLQSLFLLSSSVLFLAVLSLLFDYHEHGYPSRLYPYFVSGRIISGAILPFILIYARGLEVLSSRLGKWLSAPALLAILMLLITISEFRVRSNVFSSHYNFFALSGWRS